MSTKSRPAAFNNKIRKSDGGTNGNAWAFASVPPEVSQSHLRRGRVTARISLGSSAFDALMEPDGKLGHWFRIPSTVLKNERLSFGQEASFTLIILKKQPDPTLPSFFRNLLKANPSAQATWNGTTTLAKIDWVHWMESAKQLETKRKRAVDAIDMLEKGKKRVCCFDPSGFYSKALSCPTEGIP